jgi:hypothetical protein
MQQKVVAEDKVIICTSPDLLINNWWKPTYT